MIEAHEVLGVAPDATDDEVKRAYRTLVRIYHPDRFGTASGDVLTEANRRMQSVTQAYKTMQGERAGQVVYWDLPGWTNGQRASVAVRLLKARIPHRWDAVGSLSVERHYEHDVDTILADHSR